MKKINQNVKRLRKERKLTQEIMCKHFGITRSGYSKKEKSGNFDASDILILTKIFNVPIEAIWGNESTLVFNDSEEGKPVIEDRSPLNLTAKERQFMLNLRKLPRERFNEEYAKLEKEIKNLK